MNDCFSHLQKKKAEREELLQELMEEEQKMIAIEQAKREMEEQIRQRLAAQQALQEQKRQKLEQLRVEKEEEAKYQQMVSLVASSVSVVNHICAVHFWSLCVLKILFLQELSSFKQVNVLTNSYEEATDIPRAMSRMSLLNRNATKS